MSLRSFWRPVTADCGLPTGTEKAAWLASYITTSWDELGRPCGREVVELALAYCDERAAAFDPFIERVSTGLANLRDFEGDESMAFLEVATRCL